MARFPVRVQAEKDVIAENVSHGCKHRRTETSSSPSRTNAQSGFVTVASNTFHERMGVIDIIGVDPAYQRRGISSRLTEVAIDHMRREGMDIAVVETGGDPGHAPARAAYEEAGFTLLPIRRYF